MPCCCPAWQLRIGNEAELWDRIAGDDQRDEDRRYSIGENHDAVLRDLHIGDALHTAPDSVNEDDTHADQDARVEFNTEEA